MKWSSVAIVAIAAIGILGIYFLKESPQRYQSDGNFEVDWRLLDQMDYITQNAPDELKALDGRRVKIPGFMVPLEDNRDMVTEFLLVPNPQACIHVPTPPPNQMVFVKIKDGVEARGVPIWVYGTFKLSTTKSKYGDVSFEMLADKVEDYQ